MTAKVLALTPTEKTAKRARVNQSETSAKSSCPKHLNPNPVSFRCKISSRLGQRIACRLKQRICIAREDETLHVAYASCAVSACRQRRQRRTVGADHDGYRRRPRKCQARRNILVPGDHDDLSKTSGADAHCAVALAGECVWNTKFCVNGSESLTLRERYNHASATRANNDGQGVRNAASGVQRAKS